MSMAGPDPIIAAGDGAAGGPLVVADDLRVSFHIPGRTQRLRAVDGVSLTIARGETLGLVGESGCGKSTLGRALIRLVPIASGSLRFRGRDITGLKDREMRPMRRHMQMVFQDPYASLNPRMAIGEILEESLLVHGMGSGQERRRRVGELLDAVGLEQAAAERFAHEFSGGQRQRIGIARALAVRPDFIVADEPVAALDVSIQAQIVNLLEDLQGEFGLTYLFIAHDLAVVRHISDRIAVMYLGKVVEVASSDALYQQPRHPYSISLLSAVPVPDPAVEVTRSRIILKGDVPSPMDPPSGCRFRTRCWRASEICATAEPVLQQRAAGHWSACHHDGDTAAPEMPG